MSSYDNDDIYFFGFSRGAYVARFLAEMLDHVGLLSQGNEEMARFAWKAFAQWQERGESNHQEKLKKQEMLEFLQAFRDTFSRPVRRIRFLGLFDTVNSYVNICGDCVQMEHFCSHRDTGSLGLRVLGCNVASFPTLLEALPKSFGTPSVLMSEGPNSART